MPSYSGLWQNQFNQPYSALGTNNTKELNNSLRTRLTKLITRERGGRKLMALMRALNGVAPGATAQVGYASSTYTQGAGRAIHNGGKRTITNTLDMNRATSAADVTMINAILDKTFAPNPYPRDKSGNGGSGKRNAF